MLQLLAKKYMAHDFYIKQPMQIIELNLNMILDNQSHLIIALDRSVNHPLIRQNCIVAYK